MDETPVVFAMHITSYYVGWSLILCGFLSGALLGLFFHRANFWGGYASFRRRIVRLGHIAFVALGMLNILFALSPVPMESAQAANTVTICLALGGLCMPLICFLTAWRERFRHLFFVPVVLLSAAVVTILLETLR